MSGAEVLGIIAAVIGIVDGINQLYHAANDTTSLPEAFREVASRLPLVLDILNSVHSRLGDHGKSDASDKIKPVLDQARKKASSLKKLFEEVIPLDKESRVVRYVKIVKTIGKGNKVETLMLELMRDMQLLVSEQGLDNATSQQVEQLRTAIEEISNIEPSVADWEFSQVSFTNNNSGSGTQTNNNVNGTQNNYTGNVQNFGKGH